MKPLLLLSCVAFTVAFRVDLQTAEAPVRPNLVYFLTDDHGYGDVSHLNPRSRIPTPNLDRLAREGMTFTDAHSGSAVCTPTRYGLLTGRYAWRSRLKSGVLGGLSPRLIEPDRMTVASLLRSQGYRTAAIGKWHLGMDWVVQAGKTVNVLGIESAAQVWNVDFAQPIRNGPNAVGFDYFFGISASLDMVPYAYIENDRVTRVPDRDGDFPWFEGRERRTRRGPTAAGFDAADVLGELTQRAVTFLGERAVESRRGQPFLLYLPFASPHTPILPTGEWRGKSGVNAYADFTMETDASVGRVLQALDELGLTENTLVFFAADNGCSPEADFPQLAAAGHHPSGPYRGHKADLFEGGHRVPFFARWPGRIAAGSTYPHPVGLTDLLATCADLLRLPLPDDAGEDSVSLLPVLLGKTNGPVRENIIHHSINGSFAIREGRWKLLLCPDSGGWSGPRPGSAEAASLPPVQLYDLETDPGERHNLQAEHPERVRSMIARLEQQVQTGRSTPGPPQPNHGTVDIWRGRAPIAAAQPSAEATLRGVPDRVRAFRERIRYDAPGHALLWERWRYARFLESLIRELNEEVAGGTALSLEQIDAIGPYADLRVNVGQDYVVSTFRGASGYETRQVNERIRHYEEVLELLAPALGRRLSLFQQDETDWNGEQEEEWRRRFRASAPRTPGNEP